MSDKIELEYVEMECIDRKISDFVAEWKRNGGTEKGDICGADDQQISSDVRAAIAPELGADVTDLKAGFNAKMHNVALGLQDERAEWRAELASLRARVAELEAGIRDITDDIDEDLAAPDARPLIYCEFAKDAVLGDLRRLRALLAKSNQDEGDAK